MKYGEISDYHFPAVPPQASSNDIQILADKISLDIISQKPKAVLCQGEFSLCFAVVKRLTNANILCLCATSQRKTIERYENGKTIKNAIFEFIAFRKYV